MHIFFYFQITAHLHSYSFINDLIKNDTHNWNTIFFKRKIEIFYIKIFITINFFMAVNQTVCFDGALYLCVPFGIMTIFIF